MYTNDVKRYTNHVKSYTNHVKRYTSHVKRYTNHVKKGKEIPITGLCGPEGGYRYSSTVPRPRH